MLLAMISAIENNSDKDFMLDISEMVIAHYWIMGYYFIIISHYPIGRIASCTNNSYIIFCSQKTA